MTYWIITTCYGCCPLASYFTRRLLPVYVLVYLQYTIILLVFKSTIIISIFSPVMS